ncbi:hypothetical protein [Bradyrhizobium japonicum]|uniref:hypothetical protein n=1 Tax=Bradyrhizobium japonicum TaxID=375 RepID=UPI001BAE111C|nr:hypothetical protein [Bradyrhizobium japonicum]MBR0959856.1 hypothetical protein [Bradyrhizobium japonicum]
MTKAVSASQNGLTRVYTNDDGSVTILHGGGRNWRNNNPGNIKYGNNAKAAGAIGQDNEGFAIFPDYQSGLQGMLNVLKKKYGNFTIGQAMQRYAPPSENDTDRYTVFLKERVGVPDGTLIKDLTPDELSRLVSGIPIYEGWRAGTITGAGANMRGPASPAIAQRAARHANSFENGVRPSLTWRRRRPSSRHLTRRVGCGVSLRPTCCRRTRPSHCRSAKRRAASLC